MAASSTIGSAAYMIDRFGPDETAGYPTICKGRYLCDARDGGYYAFEEPVSLNASAMLGELINGRRARLQDRGPPAFARPM
jgi:hypothetical protein